MKVLNLIFLIMFTSLSNSFSQIEVGGRSGLNISQVIANKPSGIDESKLGFHVGAVGSIGIGSSGKIFGVGELNFNQKGGKNAVSGTNSLGYIELATLVRYAIGFGEAMPLKVFLNAGPYFGINTGRTAEIAVGTKKSIEFGIGAGGGLWYPVGPGKIFLEARYNFALSNLVPQTLERNQYTSISVGFLYTLKAQTAESQDKGVQGGFE